MALDPDNVDLSQLPPRNVKLKSSDWGIMDGSTFAGNPPADKCVEFDPRDANAERGEKYLEASTNYIVNTVKKLYESI
jgi:creatinine amidohydrolase/Fe(II)-dependent formamide hydrolase-like protein